MHRLALFFLVLFYCSGSLTAQDPSQPDSVTQLSEVTVEGYISGQPLLRTPTSVGIVNLTQLQRQADESLLPALNAVPGVRMEERSPGSYRLSIRGSLLRSPWGVRNVKVYLDEFPLTDAGGNTYLNLIDPRGIGRLEVLKGPHGSLFGANSGGVLLVNTPGSAGTGSRRRSSTGLPDKDAVPPTSILNAGLSGGSYGMFHENLGFRQHWEKSRFDFNQAFLRSDGYREHSGMRRHYLQASHRWNYRPESQLKALAFYADMDYATPGGLNPAQYEADPRQARPAAGPNPGAVEQQAGIRNKTLFGGLSHQFELAPGLRHMLAVFGSYTDFENPFITNFEMRSEENYGLRTYLELDGSHNSFHFGDVSWKWHLGLEWQRSRHEITNFDNLGNATKGGLQASDAIRTSQYFYFTRFSADLAGRLRAEAAVSLNYNRYAFNDLAGQAPGDPDVPGEDVSPGNTAGGTSSGEIRFSPEWMPRLSLSYLLNPEFSWRASLSRGFSQPTTAEIRPSNITINTALNPETGWNYETGFRFMPGSGRLQADASVFYYRMKEAIVRRLDEGAGNILSMRAEPVNWA
ncbi:TonB-dependent receptor [Anseongella ginsenosidimutans]|uniref:TonB-dependent receptor n=1 Tax=Anseongella ginsenosidimutans TaxID=496056 RepID=UPI0021CE51F4|nr:TonB-dependent receptor [Anseongella ginsenosidimutans]